MYDVIIIGGGPAGLTAAAYAEHLRLKLLLIAPKLGGRIEHSFQVRGQAPVETVIGADLVRHFATSLQLSTDRHEQRHVKGIEAIPGGFQVELEDGATHQARTLIIATGARPRRLYVPGEEEYWGRGVSFSALSHAPLFGGRQVAVVGSTESAQIAALELARTAERVHLISPNTQALQEPYGSLLAGQPRVSVYSGWEVTQIDGDEFVSGLSLLGKANVTRHLAVEGVFVEMGLLAESDFVGDLVERDGQGRIKVDHRACTSHVGIMAAGDVTNVYAELVPIAIGEGAKAALSVWEYLATTRPLSRAQS